MAEKCETLLSKCEIPIIDLQNVGTDACPMKSVVVRVGEQLKKALACKGLALLVNHGIPQDKLRSVYSALDDFCDLPTASKKKYLKKSSSNHGYVAAGTEKFDEETPEIRHTFNICTLSSGLPDDLLPGFKRKVSRLSEDFKQLSILLLKALAVGLELPSQYFIEKHLHMLNGSEENASTLKLLYYPPLIPDDDEETDYIKGGRGYDKLIRERKVIEIHREGDDDDKVKKNRCCDNGTFTLLVQDEDSGLEVKLPHSERWQRVGHLPGSIFINTGELLAAWTQEKYPALPHRIIITEKTVLRRRGRHSIAFFCHPDNCTAISPLNMPSPECPCETACKKTPREHLKNAKERVFTAYHHLQTKLKGTYAS